MNQRIVDSEKIRGDLDIEVLPIRYSEDLTQINKMSVKKLFIFLKYIFLLTYKLIKNKYSVVYFTIVPHGFGLYRDVFFIVIMKIFRKKYVLHLHGKGIKTFSKKRKINHYIYKFIFNKSKIILLSEYLYDDISQYIDKDNCYYIPNCIPRIEIGIKTFQETELPVKVLFLSAMTPNKGMFVLLDALNILKNNNINFHAYFVGQLRSVMVMDKFNDIVEKNDLKNHVSNLGPIYEEEKKYKIYNDSDIFVFPTLNEAFGIVLLEAMQAGLPVVASREGSIPMIIEEGWNGFLFTKGDSKELAEKLKLLIQDRELRIKFGKNSRERFLDNFTFTKYEENFINVMNLILSDSPNAEMKNASSEMVK